MKKILLIIMASIMLTMTGCSNYVIDTRDDARVYNCDVKVFALKTKIEVTDTSTDTFIGTVSGNLITFFTDPLQMVDATGNVIGYADDTYHVINQDDHAIVVDGNVQFIMNGNFTVIGNKYTIADISGNVIASAEFNFWDTHGELVDTDWNVIAEYHSGMFMEDFTVTIYGDTFDDRAVIMLFASYYSDKHADASS